VVGEASDGRELLQAAERGDWDVLVLDLSLPRVSGHEALRRLRADKPALRIVVLSMYSEEQYAIRLLREGASAYLSKERPGEEVIEAIRRAASGATYVTQTVAERMLRAPAQTEKLPHQTLTAREYQVFSLIASGRTVSEIAAELDLTMSTISSHLHQIRSKLAVRSNAEIVGYAHRMGLVP
jgi:DNA-binding NarL/FixJ family response regulator